MLVGCYRRLKEIEKNMLLQLDFSRTNSVPYIKLKMLSGKENIFHPIPILFHLSLREEASCFDGINTY